MPSHLILLSISSDIGMSIARHFLHKGWNVTGTFRNKSKALEEIEQSAGLKLIECDLANEDSVTNFFNLCSNLQPWDLFLSAVGEPLPLTSFFDSNWLDWSKSFHVNSIAQLGILHKLWHRRRLDGEKPTVMFFAAGGTNGPVSDFSAYTSAKIHLIKMVELLAHEDPTTRYCIAGPGWTLTKTHEYMLQHLPEYDSRKKKILDFLSSPELGTSHEDICRFVEWILNQDEDAINGRNFSIATDPWNLEQGAKLAKILQQDKQMFKLRRHKNDLDISNL